MYFVSQGQIIPPPTVTAGKVVNERNVSLMFNRELDNEHCDTLLPVNEKQILDISGEVCFYTLSLLEHFL
jgi:hypothetical protein